MPPDIVGARDQVVEADGPVSIVTDCELELSFAARLQEKWRGVAARARLHAMLIQECVTLHRTHVH